jgi:hypothetical protein
VTLRTFGALATAPHADTQRWTYTVPAGKKALVEAAQLLTLRDAAATTLGRAEASILITPSGGALNRMLRTLHLINTVGERVDIFIGEAGSLLAADQIQATTEDSSTGGTMGYFATAKIMEYDA